MDVLLESGPERVDTLSEFLHHLHPSQQLEITVWDPDDDAFEACFPTSVLETDGSLIKIAPPAPEQERLYRLFDITGMIVGGVLQTDPAPYVFYALIQETKEGSAAGYWLKVTQAEVADMEAVEEVEDVETVEDAPTGTINRAASPQADEKAPERAPETAAKPDAYRDTDQSIPQIGENDWADVLQKRRHVRVTMVVPITILPSGEDGDKEPLEATTLNVSGGGLKFASSKEFRKGQRVVIQAQFNKDLPLMTLNAEVVATGENDMRMRANDFYATACQFINLDKHHESIIVRECFRRELSHGA